MAEEFKRCAHCRQRIELINFAMGPEWRHWPTLYGNYRTNEKYRYCHGHAAAPDGETDGERWKAVADSADALLRAVMDALSIRPDQDPVIEARRIAEKRAEWEAEQGETEWGVGWQATWTSRIMGFAMSSREEAEAHARESNADPDDDMRYFLVQRTPEREPGWWLPVPDTT